MLVAFVDFAYVLYSLLLFFLFRVHSRSFGIPYYFHHSTVHALNRFSQGIHAVYRICTMLHTWPFMCLLQVISIHIWLDWMQIEVFDSSSLWEAYGNWMDEWMNEWTDWSVQSPAGFWLTQCWALAMGLDWMGRQTGEILRFDGLLTFWSPYQ